jgi:hypothetical protein
MLRNLRDVIHTPMGKVLVSALLGFGLATLFRRHCGNGDCLDFRAPKIEEVEKETFRHDGKCYRFKATSVKCDKQAAIVPFA